ncbi:MAG TPA: PfkB family carbohydrate kinase, partial [Candidatus Lustribacter sp.]|nr:PfkB family carbohydrate kinase [Candidatus Lustribacter sp.]
AVLEATIDQLGAGARWLVGCGSLPPGMDDSFYAELVRRARYAGARVAIDTSGSPLTVAVTAWPDLIKPNLEELEDLVGETLSTLGDVRDAAATLAESGIGTVVVSLGRHGALLVSATQVAHAQATVAKPLSTVGAGDSLLAGFLHAISRGTAAPEALANGAAWGGAAVSLPGSRMPTPGEVAAIPVSLTTTPDFTLHVTD